MNEYTDNWTNILNGSDLSSVEVLASIREDFINEVFSKHWDIFKTIKYQQEIKKEFVLDGKVRTFTATVKINNPVKLTLPPFPAPVDVDSWIKCNVDRYSGECVVTDPSDGANLAKSSPKNMINARVEIPEIEFSFKWPKWDGSGDWIFPEDPFKIQAIAEASIYLDKHANQPGDSESLRILKVGIEKLRFDKPTSVLATELLAMVNNTEGITQFANDEAIRDLILILLNVVGEEKLPDLVYSVELPTPTMFDKVFHVELFDIRDKKITAGLSLDDAAIKAKSQDQVNRATEAYMSLLEEDLSNLHERGDLEKTSEFTVKNLPLSSAYVERLETKHSVDFLQDVRGASDGSRVPALNTALALNEYLLDSIFASSLPSPVRDCTGWKGIKHIIKGRACWWLNLFDPDINISSSDISGSVSVDAGGYIEACVKRAIDCSFRWDCGKLGLGVTGRPTVNVGLQTIPGGFYLNPTLSGKFKVRTIGVPWPFNEVIGAIGSLVANTLFKIASIIVARMKFRMLAPVIPIESLGMNIITRSTQTSVFTSPIGTGSRQQFFAIGIDLEPVKK